MLPPYYPAWYLSMEEGCLHQVAFLWLLFMCYAQRENWYRLGSWDNSGYRLLIWSINSHPCLLQHHGTHQWCHSHCWDRLQMYTRPLSTLYRYEAIKAITIQAAIQRMEQEWSPCRWGITRAQCMAGVIAMADMYGVPFVSKLCWSPSSGIDVDIYLVMSIFTLSCRYLISCRY